MSERWKAQLGRKNRCGGQCLSYMRRNSARAFSGDLATALAVADHRLCPTQPLGGAGRGEGGRAASPDRGGTLLVEQRSAPFSLQGGSAILGGCLALGIRCRTITSNGTAGHDEV